MHQMVVQLGCARPGWKPATDAEAHLVHTPANVNSLPEICASGGGSLDANKRLGFGFAGLAQVLGDHEIHLLTLDESVATVL
jgi:hypothetical protein